MIYLSIAANVVLLALYVWERHSSLGRLDRERATAVNRETKLLEKHQELVDRITVLKVDPQVAVAQAITPGDDHLVQFTRYEDDEDFHESLKELEP